MTSAGTSEPSGVNGKVKELERRIGKMPRQEASGRKRKASVATTQTNGKQWATASLGLLCLTR